jgi:uncharacterized cupredoxin-like copper-binding protein
MFPYSENSMKNLILILCSISIFAFATWSNANDSEKRSGISKEFNQNKTQERYAMSHDVNGSNSENTEDDLNDERIIEIIADDNFFYPTSIYVKRGETIKFVVTNKGMYIHELVMGTKEEQAKHHEQMRSMSLEDMDHHMHAGINSITMQPAQSQEITWTFDSMMQQIEFACHIPGHYEAGMHGLIEINDISTEQTKEI